MKLNETVILIKKIFSIGDYVCMECGKGFKSAQNLRGHMKLHVDQMIACPDCPAVFKSTDKLKKHSYVHLNLKFKCNQCSSVFNSHHRLSAHISELKFCMFILPRQNKLMVFIENLYLLGKIHNMTDADKKHVCTFCSRRFFEKNRLMVHLRSHTGDKRKSHFQKNIDDKALSKTSKETFIF